MKIQNDFNISLVKQNQSKSGEQYNSLKYRNYSFDKFRYLENGELNGDLKQSDVEKLFEKS